MYTKESELERCQRTLTESRTLLPMIPTYAITLAQVTIAKTVQRRVSEHMGFVRWDVTVEPA